MLRIAVPVQGIVLSAVLLLARPAQATTLTGTLVGGWGPPSIQIERTPGERPWINLRLGLQEVPFRSRELAAMAGATVVVTGEWDEDNAEWLDSPYFRLTSDIIGVQGRLELPEGGAGGARLVWEGPTGNPTGPTRRGALELDLAGKEPRAEALQPKTSAWVFGRLVVGEDRLPRLQVTSITTLPVGGDTELSRALHTLAEVLAGMPVGSDLELPVGGNVLRVSLTGANGEAAGGAAAAESAPGPGSGQPR